MELKELTNSEFNNFTNSFFYSSVYQTTEYGLLMNSENYTSIFLGLLDDLDNIKAASLILIEKEGMFKYAYAPKGYLIDYTNKDLLEEFTLKIKEYLNKKKVIAIKINPMIVRSSYDYKTNITYTNPTFELQMNILKELDYYHLGFNNLFESFKPRYDAILDLSKPITTLFGNMNKNFKKKIKSADENGVILLNGDAKNIDYIYNMVKGKYPRGRKYFENLLNYFSKRNMVDYFLAKLDTNAYLINIQKKYQKQIEICNLINSKIFSRIGKNNNKLINNKLKQENKLNELKQDLIEATNLLKEHPDGIIIAAMIITRFRDEVMILMDGYDKEYKSINAKHLMTWKLIEKYSKEGYRKFNLGGMTNPNLKTEKYSGLNEYKLSFNARCIEYAGDFELITNQGLYNLYRNSKPLRYILKRDK